ncbi:MAG: hypothetical protein HY397_01500 [Candidatus Doudnabacteria bacterium]|nr:hypothetical protein [Candidatus Doudnabacteria bacterium]
MKVSARLVLLVIMLSLVATGAMPAEATVTVNAGPTSLVTSPVLVKAASGQTGLFSVTLSQDAGETLSSIAVMVNPNATTTVASADLASVSVYKDDGNGSFSSSSDLLAGSNATVGVGATTTVVTGANNALDGGKFFVSMATSGSWSGTAPADSVTVTLLADGITTSANSPTSTAVTTAALTADTSAPSLVSAVAKNTGGTGAKEAGDSVDLTFSESTNKPTVASGNITSFFILNNSHSFLDTLGGLGGASWNVEGTVLTITLSGTSTPTSTLPSVATGDIVTVVGSGITDLAGNVASGAQVISGTFSGPPSGDDDDKPSTAGHCGNGLINGRLYKVGSEQTVYLAAACRLKPFRGAAVFHARGLKFQNIISLSSLPAGTSTSSDPVLPASGTLIKGRDKTVWFVTQHGQKRGFVSANAFFRLGFRFSQVQNISDDDLNTISSSSSIGENESHPDGSLLKCGNSPTVFQVVGSAQFPFTNASAFLNRGHSWNHIAEVDCGRFAYVQGGAVSE